MWMNSFNCSVDERFQEKAKLSACARYPCDKKQVVCFGRKYIKRNSCKPPPPHYINIPSCCTSTFWHHPLEINLLEFVGRTRECNDLFKIKPGRLIGWSNILKCRKIKHILFSLGHIYLPMTDVWWHLIPNVYKTLLTHVPPIQNIKYDKIYL